MLEFIIGSIVEFVFLMIGVAFAVNFFCSFFSSRTGFIHFFKVRYHAKPFDVYKECQDANRDLDDWINGDWISYDGKLYYENPWFVFFESTQNSWWLRKAKED